MKMPFSTFSSQESLAEQDKDETYTRISRSSDTMFYNNYTTNMSLSKMADRKAHILIGLNFFMLSFFIAKKHMGLLAKLHGYLIPNLCLAVSCTITIILATLVVRPRLQAKKKEGQPINWFFFGDFQHFTVEEFHDAIYNLQKDKNVLYEAISRDLYWMGLSLSRKYRLLNTAYKVFLYCQLSTATLYIAFYLWNLLH